MINIFDFINDILYKKRGDLLKDQDCESQFQPFMITRWLSMYSPQCSLLLNNTVNRYWRAYNNDDKQSWYKMLLTLLPKSKFQKINYIKKNKEPKNISPEDKELINFLATRLEMSKKEIKNIIKDHNIDIAKFKKAFK